MASKKEKLSNFQPQKRNANKHNPRGLGMLDNTIAEDGWITAITVTADGEAIDGSARLETAYTRFGEGVEPIIVRSNGDRPIIHIREDIPTADDEKAKRLAIAANRIAEVNLNWDAEVLAELSNEVDLSGLFFEDELSGILEDLASEQPEITPEQDEENTADLIDKAESGEIESRVQAGQIWQLGRHRIACGDSTDEGNVRKLLGDRVPVFTWSDPPYGIKYQSNMRTKTDKFAVIANDDQVFSSYIPSVVRYTKGWVIVCTAWKVLEDWLKDTKPLGDMKNLIVWDKGGGGIGDLTHSLLTDYELMLAFNRGSTIKGKRIGSVWSIGKDNPSDYLHPTQKPVDLLVQAYESFTEASDLIFDPFLGSAPSIIAAQKMEGDRVVYGFELSPEYCEVICRRFQSFTGIEPKLVGSL